MTEIKAGRIYMCLKDISGYDSFTKGKIYSSIYDNALINDNHIEVKVMNSECFRIATDKEVFKEKLDRLKEETSIGLSEHDNGVEQGRMEIINALYKLLDSMKEEPAGDDLEEAAKRYNEEMSWRWEAPRYPHLEAFKAGANWQKEKDEKEKSDIYDIAVDVGRKLGEADMKQQMMKGATDGQIENGEDYLH